MVAKKIQLQIFMTAIDEASFSAQIKLARPRVVFLDPATWGTTAVPVTRNSIDACAGTFVLMLDETLLPLEVYGRKFFGPHPSGIGYSGAMAAPGLLQFRRCRVPEYDKRSLASGTIAAGYDSDYKGMESFVRSIMDIAKKGGKKVYYIDPATSAALDKAMPGYWAWPDAAEIYDGSGGRYLRPDAINRMVAQ
jgi:hypothetical protein